MQHPILYLLCSPLIPKLRSDITAGSSCNGKLFLIRIPAVRAAPLELAVAVFDDLNLSVKAAGTAVIGLGIQLRIHDVLIDKLHEAQYRRNVVLEIRYLHIADCAARRKLLEVRLKGKLREGIDFLRNVYMVGVRNIVLVRHPGNLPEALL